MNLCKDNFLMLLAGCCIAVACATPAVANPIPTASDYVQFPLVDVGQKLVIRFSFDPAADLVGSLGANTIILDLGGVGNASNTVTTLYAGSTSIGSASSYSGGAAGIFFADDLGYSAGYIGSQAVDSVALKSLLDGAATGFLEVTPLGGFMTWSGWGPHSGILSGQYAFQDIFPIANIEAVRVVDASQSVASSIPTPATLPLLIVGLIVMGLIGRLRGTPGWCDINPVVREPAGETKRRDIIFDSLG